MAGTQLLLARGDQNDHSGEYRGTVALVIDPGIDAAKVSVEVDGATVASGLLPPYRVEVDFGDLALQHRITVTAISPKGRRVRWTETINRGNVPLHVGVKSVDLPNRVFEAVAEGPKEDPVARVDLWENGQIVATVTRPPWRFDLPQSMIDSGFIQVTATSVSGEEVADFWSATGGITAAELQVRTVPIFVSVVDRSGATRDDVKRSQFRIFDNDSEGHIVEFGKAFDQPISIALLIDASQSMMYSLDRASVAASEFVKRTLRPGDRFSVTAIQDVPRRKQPLTSDPDAVRTALLALKPQGRTALNDAIVSATRELREEKNRKAIVVLTDGGDTSSNYSWEDVQKSAREAGIPLYFIAYEGAGDDRDLERLRFLATETGGFVATSTQENLTARYTAIEKDLRAQFAIVYQVSDMGSSNQYRRVRVLLDSPKMTARTIRGYFTP